jgi:acyl-CoA thioester hydrolase
MITRTSFSVRYSEIDKMGIVYHANYPKWFEIGRRDYLHRAGIPHLSVNHQGFYLPLSELECKFKSPAKYGDKIIVITGITFMSCVKVKFEYKVLNMISGKPLATGNTVHAWTDRDIKPLNIEKAAPQIYTSLKVFAEIEDIIGDKSAKYIHKQ